MDAKARTNSEAGTPPNKERDDANVQDLMSVGSEYGTEEKEATDESMGLVPVRGIT